MRNKPGIQLFVKFILISAVLLPNTVFATTLGTHAGILFFYGILIFPISGVLAFLYLRWTEKIKEKIFGEGARRSLMYRIKLWFFYSAFLTLIAMALIFVLVPAK